ncbi:MAG: type III pantothenate kinase, partial [Cetobacterium sp.]
GGGILPGIEMSINALFGNTARLPKVKFSTPENILGKNTGEQIQAGIFYGYAGQIKHIIKKIKEEIKDPFVIATGGLGKILSAEIEEIDEYLPELSIKGLYTVYKINKNSNQG